MGAPDLVRPFYCGWSDVNHLRLLYLRVSAASGPNHGRETVYPLTVQVKVAEPLFQSELHCKGL